MTTTQTIRISDELATEIEGISHEEQLDQRIVVCQLLERGVAAYTTDEAFERYDCGEISLGQLADRTDLPIRRTLVALTERDIRLNYSNDSLREDVPGS